MIERQVQRSDDRDIDCVTDRRALYRERGNSISDAEG
jgi:hypothetical protein